MIKVIIVALGMYVPAGMGLADDWQSLTGSQIMAALNDRTLVYETASQTFYASGYASGRTLYESGQPSWGYWRVEGDQNCSQWPPGDLWACYDVSADENAIRFTGKDGSQSTGRYLQ